MIRMLLCMYVYSGPALASMYAPMRFAVYTVFVVIDHACLLRPPHQNFLDTALLVEPMVIPQIVQREERQYQRIL